MIFAVFAKTFLEQRCRLQKDLVFVLLVALSLWVLASCADSVQNTSSTRRLPAQQSNLETAIPLPTETHPFVPTFAPQPTNAPTKAATLFPSTTLVAELPPALAPTIPNLGPAPQPNEIATATRYQPPQAFAPANEQTVTSHTTLRWTSTHRLLLNEVFEILVGYAESQERLRIATTRDQVLDVDFAEWRYGPYSGKYSWSVRITRIDETILSADSDTFSFLIVSSLLKPHDAPNNLIPTPTVQKNLANFELSPSITPRPRPTMTSTSTPTATNIAFPTETTAPPPTEKTPPEPTDMPAPPPTGMPAPTDRPAPPPTRVPTPRP